MCAEKNAGSRVPLVHRREDFLRAALPVFLAPMWMGSAQAGETPVMFCLGRALEVAWSGVAALSRENARILPCVLEKTLAALPSLAGGAPQAAA